VIINLVGNAIKFTEHGAIVLRIERIEATEKFARLLFAVHDTGIGITTEDQARLFAPFTQVNYSATRRFGGTGLGLAISRRLVELMGGKIGLESKPGIGSTFSFEIRLEVSPQASPPVDTRSLAGTRILLLTSSTATRQAIEMLLRSLNLSCETVAASAEAIIRLRQAAQNPGQAFQILMVDAQQADSQWQGLAGEIRSDPTLAGLKSVGLRPITDFRRQMSPSEEKFDGEVFKPVKQSQLFNCLLSLCGKTEVTAGAEASPSSEVVPLPHPPRILLAEGNDINRRIALLMLEKIGCAADVVGNGQDAVSSVKRKPYDVILMDCLLPVVDGFEATRQIRKWEATRTGMRSIRIIAMTANALREDCDLCLAAGMDTYISKPIRIPSLRAALQESSDLLLKTGAR
jgi:CheY-like chemotaxis protein